ncbi:MAG: 1,4-dihydroxy-2-naphthoate polyprenyltransferase [Bacteroidaceae bacterium]|nr:1,4-dihydroxy-2-naphthoate polyprenyltransferase [Bacteroidaceae bacterium]
MKPETRKAWIDATRPRTLPASAAPVVAATAYAWYDGVLVWGAALLCLLFALLAQIASNMANDYFDYKKGGDSPDRVGPQRAVVSGLITPRAMLIATLVVLLAACCVGLGLVVYGGWQLIPVGAVIALFAMAYSAGPFPLSRYGLGDVTVFIFFGLIAVNFTYYVQAGVFTLPVFWASVAQGLLAINILLVNNYRDMEEDAAVNKRTTVVLFGRRFASTWYLLNGFFAVACTRHIWMATPTWAMILLPMIYLVMHLAAYRALTMLRGKALNPLLGRTALNLLIYTILLIVAMVVAKFS